MEAYTRNGGFIGKYINFDTAEKYIVGETIATITLVGTTSSTGTSITLPAGLLEGDMVVIASVADSTTQTLPTGYTPGQNGAINTTQYIWSYKFMGAVPDTTAVGLSSTSAHIAFVFRGVDTTSPFAAVTPAVSSGITGRPDAPAVTTVTDNAVIVAMGFLDDDSVASSVTAPATYTLINAEQNGSTVMTAYKTKTPAGIDDPAAFGGTGSDAWVGATFAVKPGISPLFGNMKNSGIWDLLAPFNRTFINPEEALGTPSRTLNQLDSFTPVAPSNPVIAIDIDPIVEGDFGVILEIGGSGGSGFGISLNDATNSLHVAAYTSNNGWQGSGQAWLVCDFSQYYGKEGTLYIVCNDSNKDLALYWLQGGRFSKSLAVLLGYTSVSTSSATWGTNAAGVGFLNSTMVNLGFVGYDSNYTGTINQVRIWDSTNGTDPLEDRT